MPYTVFTKMQPTVGMDVDHDEFVYLESKGLIYSYTVTDDLKDVEFTFGSPTAHFKGDLVVDGNLTVGGSGGAGTGGSGSTDPEVVRDTIAAALTGGSNITVTANDAANTITVATNATVNSSDAFLLSRGNQTGTQSADTITDGTTNKAYTATEKTKLSGVATGATQNSTDAYLVSRNNHTGTQPSTTISDFTEAVQDTLAAALVAGTNMTVSYDDAAGKVTLSSLSSGVSGSPGTAAVTTKAWVSNPSGSKVHSTLTTTSFTGATSTSPSDVVVDPTVNFQRILGFGAALTEASAFLLMTQLSVNQRTAFLQECFATDQGNMSVVRISIASCDFVRNPAFYSYDEVAGDTSMTNFSVGSGTPGSLSSTRDLTYIIPVLQQILAINPNVKVIACPWSPPSWLKSNNSLITGAITNNASNFTAYAQYFVKFIQAYRTYGIPIYSVSLQNEPTVITAGRMCCSWSGADLATFAASYLGPALDNADLNDVQIITGDDNWSKTFFNTAAGGSAAAWVKAVAFHGYSGDPSAQSPVLRSMTPNQSVWFTELRSLLADSLTSTMDTFAGTIAVESIKRSTELVCIWNLALDQAGLPTQGSTGRRGVVTVSTTTPGSVQRNPEYAVLRHLSQHVLPGAVRVRATSTLPCVAFRNPNGDVVTFIYNSATSGTISPRIFNGGTNNGVQITLGGRECATVVTSAAQNLSAPNPQGVLPGAITAVPDTPVLSLDSVTGTSANIHYNTGWVGGSVTTLTLKRSTSVAGLSSSPTTVATLDQTTAVYTDTTLSTSSTYYYRLDATNSTGTSVSNVLTVSTTGQTVTAPSDLTLTATPGDKQVTITASGGTGTNVSIALYRGSAISGTPISTTLPFTDTNLTNGTSYSYIATASNSGGTATSPVVTATPTATVTVPTALTITATPGNGQVTITATGGTGTGVAYALYRSSTVGGTPIATSFPYTDTGRTNGSPVSYVATSTNTAGSVTSNVATVTPAAPTSLSMDAFSSFNSAGNSQTGSFTHTPTSTGVNLACVLLDFGVTANGGVDIPQNTTVTYGGLNMTKVDRAISTGAASHDRAVELWYLVNPPTGAQTVVANLPMRGTVVTPAAWVATAYTFTGAAASPIGTYATYATTLAAGDTTASVTVSSPASSIVITGVAARSTTNLTPSSGQVSQFQGLSGTNMAALATTTTGSPAGVTVYGTMAVADMMAIAAWPILSAV